MKRYFKTIAAAMLSVLAVAACQKENLGGAQDGQEVDVNLTLTSPEIGTKAYGDGQTVNTVHVWVYQVAADGTMTYIVPAASGEAATPTQEVEMKNGTAKYSTRLVTGQKYTFVFWADYHKDGYTSPYTYNSDSKTITVDYANAAGNDEKRDAFYNVLKDVEITGAYSTDVKLYRPFAQINFGASDLAAAKNGKLDVQKAAVKLTKAATSLNLLSGTVAGEAEVTFAETALAGGKLSVGGVDYDYLAMDYVLVGKDSKTLSDVTLSANNSAWNYTYSNVPLQGNYRTNIVGNLFTNPTTVSITVAPGFNEPGNNVYPELLAVAANGGSITLSDDVELSEPLVIAAGKDAVINLNGKTVTFKGGKDDAHCSAFRVKGSLTIEGDGTIDGGGDEYTERNIVWANGADAKVIIKGGNFKMGKNTAGAKSWYDCIYANKGGKVEIYGGTFQNDCEGRPQSLNIQNDGENASILVYGGSFINYDPSTGDDKLGGSFVADGFTSLKTSSDPDVYTVEKTATLEENGESFRSALTGGGNIKVSNNILVKGKSFSIPSGKDTHIEIAKNTTISLNKAGQTLKKVFSFFNDGGTLSGEGSIISASVCSASASDVSAIEIESGKELKIKGNLYVDGGSNAGSGAVNAAIIIRDGKVSIDGGYFHVGLAADGSSNPCIYLFPTGKSYKAELEITGGVFESEPDSKGSQYVINCHDDKSFAKGISTVSIKGGTFVGFDPADNSADGEHTNYVADGYKSQKTTYNGKDAWEVVPE